MSKGNKAGNSTTGPRIQKMNNTRNDPIATALRRLHDDIVAEAVPDEFMKLLSEIDQRIDEGKSA